MFDSRYTMTDTPDILYLRPLCRPIPRFKTMYTTITTKRKVMHVKPEVNVLQKLLTRNKNGGRHKHKKWKGQERWYIVESYEPCVPMLMDSNTFMINKNVWTRVLMCLSDESFNPMFKDTGTNQINPFLPLEAVMCWCPEESCRAHVVLRACRREATWPRQPLCLPTLSQRSYGHFQLFRCFPTQSIIEVLKRYNSSSHDMYLSLCAKLVFSTWVTWHNSKKHEVTSKLEAEIFFSQVEGASYAWDACYQFTSSILHMSTLLSLFELHIT